MAMSTAAPQWSLAGVHVPWADGQDCTISQTGWTRTEGGWISDLYVPRVTESGKVRFVNAKLFVADVSTQALPQSEPMWMRAKNLLAQQMHDFGWNEDDLGEIVIAD